MSHELTTLLAKRCHLVYSVVPFLFVQTKAYVSLLGFRDESPAKP